MENTTSKESLIEKAKEKLDKARTDFRSLRDNTKEPFSDEMNQLRHQIQIYKSELNVLEAKEHLVFGVRVKVVPQDGYKINLNTLLKRHGVYTMEGHDGKISRLIRLLKTRRSFDLILGGFDSTSILIENDKSQACELVFESRKDMATFLTNLTRDRFYNKYSRPGISSTYLVSEEDKIVSSFIQESLTLQKGDLKNQTIINTDLFTGKPSTTFHSIIDVCFAYLILEYGCGIHHITERDGLVKITSDGFIKFWFRLTPVSNRLHLLEFNHTIFDKEISLNEFKAIIIKEISK